MPMLEVSGMYGVFASGLAPLRPYMYGCEQTACYK